MHSAAACAQSPLRRARHPLSPSCRRPAQLLRPAAPLTLTPTINHTSPKPTHMSAACPDCLKGSLDEGTPRGQDTTLGGVPCYISKPSAAAAAAAGAAGASTTTTAAGAAAAAPGNGCAVILATDIFGYKLINARLIADAFAAAGYTCVVPDYFEGEPMNMALLETFESLPERGFLGKLAAGLQLAAQIVNLGLWFRRHPFSHAVGVVTDVAAALRQEHGATKVGLQGYCYGGTTGILVASQPGVLDAVCSAHPGSVKLPDDVQGIVTPILFVCAESDAQFPAKTRTAVQEILEEKAPGLSSFILYPGTKHGFAVRGSRQDPAVNAARQDALQQAVRFFGQHLTGTPPPAQRLDESTPAPVGKKIVLNPKAC